MRKAIAVPVFILIALAHWVSWEQPLRAASIKDSESATHGFDAASYQIVNTYDYPGFKVIQLTLPVLSHYSYLLASGGQALVVDPGRDIQTYLETAAKHGLTIKGVFLTHSHADFVAGHTEMAKAVGCPIYCNASSGAEYPHQPVKEGSTIQVGEATLRIVETPGHTPDGLCGYVFGSRKSASPDVIFTGDTLFVGSVGRPDLMGGTISAAALASMMYDTWTKKLSKAGDGAVIFPAHGAGSLCGAHLSDQPFSTLGAEKKSNSYFQVKTRNDFIAAVLDGLPEAPQYFKHNAAMNRKGPDGIEWNAVPEPVTPDAALLDPSQHQVVDLRDPAQYAAGHIPNAVNIGTRGRLETWVGIMVPWGAPLVLCGSKEETEEAGRRLHRVGYRAVAVSMDGWKEANLPVFRSSMIAPRDLYAQMQKGQGPVVVDVRLPNEWMGIRIGMVVNLPLNHLGELASKLDPSQPVVTVCNSAYRSSMAVGVLERRGFKQVSSLAGGSEAWMAAGLPVYGADVQAGKPAAAVAPPPVRDVKLPERVGAADLRRLIQDLPGTFDLVDIRPADQFADFSIPGSRNVDIVDAIKDPSLLTGAGPLILVDRDGSLAMAIGGILSQKSQRVIKVLYGGLQAYWDETEKQTLMGQTHGGGSMNLGVPSEKGSAGPLLPAAPGATPPPGPSEGVLPAKPAPEPRTPPPSQPAKPKSAGC